MSTNLEPLFSRSHPSSPLESRAMPLGAVERLPTGVLDRQVRPSMAMGRLFWMAAIKHGIEPPFVAASYQARQERGVYGQERHRLFFLCMRLYGTLRYLHKCRLCAPFRNLLGARMESKTQGRDQKAPSCAPHTSQHTHGRGLCQLGEPLYPVSRHTPSERYGGVGNPRLSLLAGNPGTGRRLDTK